MTTQKGSSGSRPSVLSELKISAESAFPEAGHIDRRKRYPRTLGLPDPTELSRNAELLYKPYVVKSNGELRTRPERFCQLIAEEKGNKAECYLKAGYRDTKNTHHNCWLLQQKPEVCARIALLKTERYRLAHAQIGEVIGIIDDIDAGRSPDIDHNMLLRQWAVNLALARKAGDTLAANRALSNIQKLADYDTTVAKNILTATTHPQDRPDAEDGNHVVAADILDGELTEGEHAERTTTPPTAAELAEVLLHVGGKD
jgi:hypothetical protein